MLLNSKQILARKQAILDKLWFLTLEEQEDLERQFLMRTYSDVFLDQIYITDNGEEYLSWKGEDYFISYLGIGIDYLEKVIETEHRTTLLLLSFRRVKKESKLRNSVVVQKKYSAMELDDYIALQLLLPTVEQEG